MLANKTIRDQKSDRSNTKIESQNCLVLTKKQIKNIVGLFFIIVSILSPTVATSQTDYGDAPNHNLNGGTNDDKYKYQKAWHTDLIQKKPPYYHYYIGDTVTGEASTPANYAKIDGEDEDDGLVKYLSIAADDKLYQLRVKCNNPSNATLTLGGWIDFNTDGLFDASEYASATVDAGSGPSEVVLEWGNLDTARYLLGSASLTGADDTTTYDTNYESIGMRLRIAELGSIDSSSFEGGISHGEVEDYMLNISCSCEDGETDNWVFGFSTAITFDSLSVDGYPTAADNGGKLETREGCTSISTPCGELILYSDGKTVYGSEHQKIAEGLYGNESAAQSGILIRSPYRSDIYYMFGNNQNGGTPTYYSIIDLKLNDGQGGLARGYRNATTGNFTFDDSGPELKNLKVSISGINNLKTNESLTACRKPGYDGYWVMCHAANSNNNDFYIGNITPKGITWSKQDKDNSDINNVKDLTLNTGNNHCSSMRLSPDGTKLAVVYSTNLYLYDFNPTTGELSNERRTVSTNATADITLDSRDIDTSNFTHYNEISYLNCDSSTITYKTSGNDDYSFYGLEYCPSSDKLYASIFGSGSTKYGGNGGSKNEPGILLQISLKNTEAKLETVFCINNNLGPESQDEQCYGVAGLQLAKDGRIYFTDGGATYLGAINEPEVSGYKCDINPNAVTLEASPDTIISGIAQLGLPNFMSGLFYKPNITTRPEYVLVNNTLYIDVNSNAYYKSLIVNYGDNEIFEINVDTFPITLEHVYLYPGIYDVTLSCKKGLCPYTFTREVEITNDMIVSTEYVDSISETNAMLHAEITKGAAIAEYGFTYSQTKRIDTLITYREIDNDSIKTVKTTLTSTQDFSDIGKYNLDVNSLDPRQFCFYRAYIKDVNDSISEGLLRRFISEKRDLSLELDGASAVVVNTADCKKHVNTWGDDNSFSIDFWVKRDRNNTAEHILHNSVVDYGLSFDNNNNLGFTNGSNISNSNTLWTTTTLPQDSTWYHVAFTYSPDSIRFYINGTKATTDGNIGQIQPAEDGDPGNLFIGCKNITAGTLKETFSGKIDALRFWSTSLTAGEIDTLLSEHTIINPTDSSLELTGRGGTMPNLSGEDLTCLFDFNAMSMIPNAETAPPPTLSYLNNNEMFEYNFFQESSRLNKGTDDKSLFTLAVLGNAKPSVDLPWVGWRHNADDNRWLHEDSWTGYCYPGEGISNSELYKFEDVTSIAINDSVDYCEYTIINESTTGTTIAPTVKDSTPPDVNVLVDRPHDLGSYEVDNTNNASLTIRKSIISRLFSNKVNTANSSVIRVNDGSIEVY